MSNNAMEDEKRQKGRRQLNLRVYKDDRVRLEHIQTVTGLANRSEVLRYALKYTSDQYPVPLPPNESVDPTLLRDIAGLTGLLRAFFNAATEHMDKESEVYRSFVARLLLNIGDPIKIWSLFAENLPASMVVLHYTVLCQVTLPLCHSSLQGRWILSTPTPRGRVRSFGEVWSIHHMVSFQLFS